PIPWNGVCVWGIRSSGWGRLRGKLRQLSDRWVGEASAGRPGNAAELGDRAMEKRGGGQNAI
ncbi:MAG: hypothetical protein QW683_08895, partial [Candidatus Caldarchaeum sp.]